MIRVIKLNVVILSAAYLTNKFLIYFQVNHAHPVIQGTLILGQRAKTGEPEGQNGDPDPSAKVQNRLT